MSQRIVKPAVCKCELINAPIAPCEILPNGFPGDLEINGTEYAVKILGYLPEEGEPVVDGYRLTKYNGESHDICMVAGRLECTCGDWTWRRAAQAEPDMADCKHTKAVKHLLAEPRDQNEESRHTEFVPASEYAVQFDDP